MQYRSHGYNVGYSSNVLVKAFSNIEASSSNQSGGGKKSFEFLPLPQASNYIRTSELSELVLAIQDLNCNVNMEDKG